MTQSRRSSFDGQCLLWNASAGAHIQADRRYGKKRLHKPDELHPAPAKLIRPFVFVTGEMAFYPCAIQHPSFNAVKAANAISLH